MKKLLAVVLGVALAGVGTVALATRNSSGTYTLPSGNPVVSGTSISTTWANNTLGDISQALTDSLDRNGKGGMLAPLRVTNGSLTAPTLSWTNDTDTGLYLVGDANPAMTVAGVQRQAWTSAGSSVTGTFSVSGASTLTGVVTLPATPVLQAGATVSAGNVDLTQAAGQSIAKTGGSLTISAAGANEIAFYTNGAQAGSFLSSGNLWMNLKRIENVATPTASGDAATMGYVDTAAPATTKVVGAGKFSGTGTPTLAAGYVGLSSLARVGGAPIGRYQVSVAGADANSIVIATPGNNGAMGAGLVLAAAVDGAGLVSIDARDNTGALIDPAQIAVMVIAGN